MSLLDLAACEPQIDTLPYPSRGLGLGPRRAQSRYCCISLLIPAIDTLPYPSRGLGLGPRRAQRTILILCWQPYYNRVFFARRSGVGAMVMEVVGQEAVGFSFSRISCFLTILFPSDSF
jgi:hypothetical protein